MGSRVNETAESLIDRFVVWKHLGDLTIRDCALVVTFHLISEIYQSPEPSLAISTQRLKLDVGLRKKSIGNNEFLTTASWFSGPSGIADTPFRTCIPESERSILRCLPGTAADL